MIFVPFHYGTWDAAGSGPSGTANELTITSWDPVSKQPLFKVAAVRVTKVGDAVGPARAPTIGAPAPIGAGVPATAGGAAAEASSTTEHD